MGTTVTIIVLIFAALIAMAPILFAAWAFGNSFQVGNYIKLLKQITFELQRLNDYNEGRGK
jgi:uncharacterized membrane protein